METYQLLNSAAELGYLMLKNGAEIYRVEGSIKLIFRAYGYKDNDVDVFAIPSSIVVTVIDSDGKPVTKSKRVAGRVTDLDKVDKLNNLSRHICRRKPSYRQIDLQIEKIMSRKNYPLWIQIISYSVIASLFTVFFDGSWYDALVALVIGALIRLLGFVIESFKGSSFFTCVISSGMAASLAFLAVYLNIGNGLDKIIIGSLMTLVPGMALTNCMRDFIAGDFMAGLSRMAEALLVAAGIAAGVAVPLTLLKGLL